MKNNNNNTKRKNKKLHVFFIFLLLSILFWTLSKLSKEYIHTVTFKAKYVNLTKNKILQNKPNAILQVVLKASGFKLLGHNLHSSTLKIDLKNVQRKRQKFYFITNNHLSEFQTQLSSEETIIQIKPDTIFFDFGKLKSKKIKVIPAVKIDLKEGYNLLGGVKTTPEIITVTGPEKQLGLLDEVKTVLVTLKNVSKSFKKTVALDIPKTLNKVHFSKTDVVIKGDVEKYTEGSLYVDFEIKNIPNGFNITTLSKKVKITYKVSLDNFNKIQASDFKVVCDFKKTQSEGLNYLFPILIKQSNMVSDIKITPKTIEFLIKK